MSPGSSTDSYPVLAHIGLRENPGKNLNQVTCPDRESNPGHLVSRLDALAVTPQVWTSHVYLTMLYQVRLYFIVDEIDDSEMVFGEMRPRIRHILPGIHLTVGENLGKKPTSLLSKSLKVRIYKTVILPVVLYGCETWTLTLREEQRLRVFENKGLCEGGNEPTGSLKAKVEKFKYQGATVTNINDTREEIKHRIKMGNACYYSVKKLLSSSLLSKNLKVRIYKTVILPVVLYGCETWTLSLREENRLRVFENKVLRKIFGAKRDEVTGEWRKLHNAELHALYSSPDIIRNIKSRRLRWAGHVARMGESRNAYRVLVGRSEGKRTLGRPRRRWEDNIKMDLREVGYDVRNWINLAQDRDQWRVYKNKRTEIDNRNKKKEEGRKERKITATGVAQSAEALACRSGVKLRSGVGSILSWADYLVGVPPPPEVFPNPKANVSDVRFELTTSVPQESRSHRLHGTLSDVARWREERGCITSRDEFARASGAGREERALDFSGMPSLETVSEKARASKPAGVRLECASASASASEGLSSSAVDRSWRDLSSSAVDRSWRDPSSSTVNCVIFGEISNLTAKEMWTPQKTAQCVSWFYRDTIRYLGATTRLDPICERTAITAAMRIQY
ncbi:hypothetical protein ANN_11935 [Periplaneta americana]|uniref:Endonuclease-reverse transcriptase n=1 Tax=Periplaneta americana TaxID=6978 RepID=A0ABQ8T7T7_PERAM|nr:hypothetical protein ANN_11935 [Periplaneta americana]